MTCKFRYTRKCKNRCPLYLAKKNGNRAYYKKHKDEILKARDKKQPNEG